MESRYLIDSNVVIYLSSDKIPEPGKKLVAKIIDSQPEISIITKIELLGFRIIPKYITLFIDTAAIINIDDEIVNRTIQIRKKHKIKLPDAIIAATAIVNNQILVTRNNKDFDKITGVQIFNPFETL